MTASIFLCELEEAGQQQMLHIDNNTLMLQLFIMFTLI